MEDILDLNAEIAKENWVRFETQSKKQRRLYLKITYVQSVIETKNRYGVEAVKNLELGAVITIILRMYSAVGSAINVIEHWAISTMMLKN